MLHILFVILKILGIILACILGLLLLLILIVLFVPIRYRVDVKKREEVIVKMRVNWLLRIVFMRGWFIDNQLHIKLRIFGFTIWDNLRPKKGKKVKIKKGKKEKSKKKETKSEKIRKEVTNKEVIKSEENEEETNREVIKNEENDKEEIKNEVIKNVEIKKSEIKKEDIKFETTKNAKLEYSQDFIDNKDTELVKENIFSSEDASENQEENQSFENEEQSQKTSKIKEMIHKIKGFFHKLKQTIMNIKSKVKQLLQLFRKLLDKKNLVTSFFKDETNRAGIKLALGHLLNILKHCGPQRIEGYVKFGTGDPEQTGKILGVIAIFYGKYGQNVSIEPDFEEKVFEAEGMVKGRIRIFHLLIIGIKAIRDKNIKSLLKNARQLKEEL